MRISIVEKEIHNRQHTKPNKIKKMTEDKKESKNKESLEELKKEYSEIKKEHNLPDFNHLNENFYLEKLVDIETDFLLREVRKMIADKMINYLKFFEAFMNPSTAPVFIHSIMKTLDNDSKEKIKKVYERLSKREVELIDLDLIYDGKKEADFINGFTKEWNEMKKDLSGVVDIINKNWNTKVKGNNKDYFG